MGERIHALAQLLLGKSTVEECSLEEIQHLVKRYPYFAPAQFLLLQKLKSEGLPELAAQQQKAVLYYPDPLQFEYFISSDKFYVDEASLIPTEEITSPSPTETSSRSIEPDNATVAEEQALPKQSEIVSREESVKVEENQITDTKPVFFIYDFEPGLKEEAFIEQPSQKIAKEVNVEKEDFLIEHTTASVESSNENYVETWAQLDEEGVTSPIGISSLGKVMHTYESQEAESEALPTEVEEKQPATEVRSFVEHIQSGENLAETEIKQDTIEVPEKEAMSEDENIKTPISYRESRPIEKLQHIEVSTEEPKEEVIAEKTEVKTKEESKTAVETNHPLNEPLDITKTSSEETIGPIFEPYHTVDYFASQGIKVSQEEIAKDKLAKQLRSFTEWLKMMKRLPAAEIAKTPKTVGEKSVESMANHSIAESDVVTEAMAEVWAKQGNREKAIETYNKLSLLNPSKRTYFAGKIENLKLS